ncbi:hypothetical protein DFH11DRAFT_1569588 [Phellopilus nigrolimitatus]|nr:hypothetical protein DFH11DRAFT_1569588 [Phellopilus nigrolimitatus]
MPDYVYALHDFAPEHEDEVAFSMGDPIEVIEKDDMYGDGWWQGRNLFGKIGLFPQSYTTSDPSAVQPPAASSTNGNDAPDPAPAPPLQTLGEEAETASVVSDGNDKAERDGADGDRVMRATLTDVQEAIEQLGRKDRDGGGSFSFGSLRDGGSTDREGDTDHEMDTETGTGNRNGEAWHKGARSNLAEKARQQQELLQREQADYDAEMKLHAPIIAARLSEPPIEFEMSDESEGEDDLDHEPAVTDTLYPRRDHAHIPEEEEEDEGLGWQQTNGHATTPKAVSHDPEPEPSESLNVPRSEDTASSLPATARQLAFPTETEATEPGAATEEPHPDSITSAIQSTNNELATPQAQPSPEPELKRMGAPHALPSPPTSQNGTFASQIPKAAASPPSEWSVEEVVEWAKSKGFDSSVTDKFIEHEISGDVLLELDANVLKTELEIHAFGKRSRIVKEIAELRRPPSVVSSVQLAPSQSHSRTISQSISLPSSAHHSLHSPLGAVMSPDSPPNTGDLAATPSPGMGSMRRGSDPSSSARVSETDQDQESTTVNNSMLGLGIGAATSILAGSAIGSMEKLEPPKGKNRPAYLNLSPSDNSLSTRAKSIGANFSPKSAMDESIRDDRAALSDTESAALDNRSRRRRIFGRSTGSSHSDQKDSASRNSKEAAREASTTPIPSVPGSLPGSPSTKRGSTDDGSMKNHQRRKRSVDASKPTDRLSLFGGTLSLTRSRKPPPRVQSYAHDDLATEKHSRSLSRLYLSSSSRKASARSQAGGEDEKETMNPHLLRKRTSSVADIPALPGISGMLKSGHSVLEQIGQPDHNGWLHKKGEHYNTWKLRYFVLKGPHLYYLRSNSKSETKIKGYINIVGYKVIVDENINPGKYGFRLIHEQERTHYFSSDTSITVRDWMKALMKATIGRDYTKPVISSCNIPTIPLAVAQTMNPAPRPPSPSQRDATQKALRRENPNQLSTRDARVLMGLPSGQNGGEADKARPSEALFNTLESLSESPDRTPVTPSAPPPTRPSRETRRTSVPPLDGPNMPADLIQWANNHLPQNLQVPESGGKNYSGLALYRLAEAIKGKPTEPAVPDSAFPTGPNDDRLDGLFKLFDFFLDNDIRMGSVSINDVRQGRTDKIVHLLRSLKAWEEKRRTLARSIARTGAHAGPFMAMEAPPSGMAHAW